VDRFTDEWGAHRAELRIDRLAPLMRVLRLASLLEKELSGIVKSQGITGAQFQVLAALRRRDPQPQSLSSLTRIAILTSGSMTSLVDRLEERGLVRRRPHPEDRRGVLLELTASGRKAVDAALVTRVRRLHELADRLDDKQLLQLSDALRQLVLAVEPSDEDVEG
jgi:DNA-binding MarR family transcriptional regulator